MIAAAIAKLPKNEEKVPADTGEAEGSSDEGEEEETDPLHGEDLEIDAEAGD